MGQSLDDMGLHLHQNLDSGQVWKSLLLAGLLGEVHVSVNDIHHLFLCDPILDEWQLLSAWNDADWISLLPRGDNESTALFLLESSE